MALPMNSGAEAVETRVESRPQMGVRRSRVFRPGAPKSWWPKTTSHGRTIFDRRILSSDAQYRKRLRTTFRPGLSAWPSATRKHCATRSRPNTCAFLVEPIQGEAGIIVPPAGYLREVAAICREHNVLLICDEIQSGLGSHRQPLFAYMHDEIVPDVVIIEKALSGGFYPVSAVLASREVLGVFSPGDHGSTFGGNPLACAVARAALRVIVDENLSTRSAELGAYALDRLRQVDSPHIASVRGKGLWIAIDLNSAARPFCEALKERGVLCKETHDTVIRLAPPLMISREDLDWGLSQIEDVLVGPLESRGAAETPVFASAHA